jgi:hypothetical protein
MTTNNAQTTPLNRLLQRMLRLLLVGLVAASVAACGGQVQEGYDDEDTGSPSQGAPLDGGDIDEDSYNEEEGGDPEGEPEE